MMKTSAKFLVITAVILAAMVVFAGKNLADSFGYLRASASCLLDGFKKTLPTEVRDEKRYRDLAQARAELVVHKVKLSRGARNIARLRDEMKSLSARIERDGRLLAETYPVLQKAAARGNVGTVQFASAEIAIEDLNREIDDLLARRGADTKALAAKREALARLEGAQNQANIAIADAQRELETAVRETDVLIECRNSALVVDQTFDTIEGISAELKAPRASIAESLGSLRDEVNELETRNDVRRAMAPVSASPKGGTLARRYSRLDDVKAICDEIQADPNRQQKTNGAQATTDRAASASNSRTHGSGE